MRSRVFGELLQRIGIGGDAPRTPRASSDCSAIESRWMWANVRTRRFNRASSDVRTSRLPAVRAARNATSTRQERRRAHAVDELGRNSG